MAPQLIERDGVTVYVYGREHLPPHLHAFAGDDVAQVNIRAGEIIEGYISGKKLKVVQGWLKEGNNRKLAEQNFYELNPRLKPKVGEEKKEMLKKKTKSKGGK